MQYVAMVECLKLVRNLAAKTGTVAVAAVTAAAANKKAGGEAKGTKGSAAGTSAVKGMEELAHALGALEALLSEGAGDTSASGEEVHRSPFFHT